MALISEIQNRLSQYLSNQLTLDDFEDWFVQATWNIHQHADKSAQKLAYEVELRLAEYSIGHLTPTELQNELRPFASRQFLVVRMVSPEAADFIPTITTSSTASTAISAIRYSPEAAPQFSLAPIPQNFIPAR